MKKFVLLLFFLLSISSNSLGFIRDSEIENLIKFFEKEEIYEIKGQINNDKSVPQNKLKKTII